MFFLIGGGAKVKVLDPLADPQSCVTSEKTFHWVYDDMKSYRLLSSGWDKFIKAFKRGGCKIERYQLVGTQNYYYFPDIGTTPTEDDIGDWV